MSDFEKLSMLETKKGSIFKVGEKVKTIFHRGAWFDVFFKEACRMEVFTDGEVKRFLVEFSGTSRFNHIMDIFFFEYQKACSLHPVVGKELFSNLDKDDVVNGLLRMRNKIADRKEKGKEYAMDALLCEMLEANEAEVTDNKENVFTELIHVVVVAFRMAEMAYSRGVSVEDSEKINKGDLK